MPNIDLSKFEKHNIVTDNQGRLWSRKGFVLLKKAVDVVAVSDFCGGFTVRVPSSNEVVHHVFTQTPVDGVVQMHVMTETFTLMYSVNLGPMPKKQVFTWAMVNNQIMINSPSMSSPLYGLPGGGLMPALKLSSINDDTTAIDIPAGHICSFGDRMPIAQGSIVYFNDPGVDPRTYVAENTLPLTGTVYDIFQGPDGSLYMFTSNGLFIMASDALGQGQSVSGFVSLLPNVETSRPGNACSTPYGVVVLTEKGLLVVGGQEIEFSTFRGRRSLTKQIDCEDIRQFGRVYPINGGVIVGFDDSRDYAVLVDLAGGGDVTFLHNEVGAGAVIPTMQVVGVLRDRDGTPLIITKKDIRMMFHTGSKELTTWTGSGDGDKIRASLAGRLQAGPGDNPLVRRISVSVANSGAEVDTACNGNQDTGATTSVNGDLVADDAGSVWGVSRWSGTTTRSVRTTLNVRATEPNIEVRVSGGDRRIANDADVQTGGTWRTKRETQE